MVLRTDARFRILLNYYCRSRCVPILNSSCPHFLITRRRRQLMGSLLVVHRGDEEDGPVILTDGWKTSCNLDFSWDPYQGQSNVQCSFDPMRTCGYAGMLVCWYADMLIC